MTPKIVIAFQILKIFHFRFLLCDLQHELRVSLTPKGIIKKICSLLFRIGGS